MKYAPFVSGIAALALIAAPLASANAESWHHGGWGGHGGWGRGYDHGGHGGGGLLLGVVAATAALVTLPFAIAGDIVSGPAPVYAAPQPVYAPAPAYYPAPPYGGYPGQQVVYSQAGYPVGYVVVR